MALGKVYGGVTTIHNIHYVDDVVKVSVTKVYVGNGQVLFLTSEIQYVSQALNIFIA